MNPQERSAVDAKIQEAMRQQIVDCKEMLARNDAMITSNDKQIAKNERALSRWWNKPFAFILAGPNDDLKVSTMRLRIANDDLKRSIEMLQTQVKEGTP